MVVLFIAPFFQYSKTFGLFDAVENGCPFQIFKCDSNDFVRLSAIDICVHWNGVFIHIRKGKLSVTSMCSNIEWTVAVLIRSSYMYVCNDMIQLTQDLLQNTFKFQFFKSQIHTRTRECVYIMGLLVSLVMDFCQFKTWTKCKYSHENNTMNAQCFSEILFSSFKYSKWSSNLWWNLSFKPLHCCIAALIECI